MSYLFEDCYDLISVEFSENFDTSHVLCMRDMFSGCDRIEHINVSSFNTTLVRDMNWMFYQCDSLTSLNLSNFVTKRAGTINFMFANSGKLSYIDISLLSGIIPFMMFDGIAQKGTIIINKNSYLSSSIPTGWKIIIKE